MMRTIQQIILMLLLAGLIACSDDETIDPPYTAQGNASVLLNGEPWQPQVVRAGNAPCFPDRLGLVMTYYNEVGLARGNFSIQNFPLELGKYRLNKARYSQDDCFSDYIWSSYGTLTDDGDVVGDVYNVVEEADNQLIISTYDSLTRELSGTFHLTLAIDEERNRTDPNAPDTIRFTEGRFHVIVDDTE